MSRQISKLVAAVEEVIKEVPRVTKLVVKISVPQKDIHDMLNEIDEVNNYHKEAMHNSLLYGQKLILENNEYRIEISPSDVKFQLN